TVLAPINVHAKPFGNPTTNELITADTILAQIRMLAGNPSTDEHIQDAALDFIASQLLSGRGKFEGFFGGALNQLINIFGNNLGVDPIEMPILNNPTTHNAAASFNLMFGDPKLGNASANPLDTNLLKYKAPELFLFLYKDIP